MILPRRLTTALVALSSLLLFSAPVLACGGFFCSQVPVEQAGEQIAFTYGPDGVTAIIQIAFQGSAEDFAWVVPVTGQPTVGLGPDAIFSELHNRTRPNFYVNWDWDNGGSCAGDWSVEASAESGAFDDNDGGAEVVVLDKQIVGPFIAVTLDATAAGAEVLLQWLDDNDFDQPEESLPIIDHYLSQELNFIAVKLKESATVGDLQPLMLTMPEAEEPCIPLVLTRIAAAPDMPVTAWVFGEHRIVPLNWFGVEINYKKIDWLSGGANYQEVATEAVNDAAGHGFITEYAMSMTTTNMLYQDGQFDTSALASISNPEQFLQEMLMQGFPRNAQMQSLIKVHIPKPAEDELPEGCKSDQEFYTWNLSECLKSMPQDWVFDPATFANDLEEKVVLPLKDGQEILDRVSSNSGESYVTRLFSTVSPNEMTRDPIFGFNRDLGDVEPWHSVEGSAECNEEDSWIADRITLTHGEESWTIEGPFEDLWSYNGEGFVDAFPNEAAAAEVVVYTEEGAPTVIALSDVAQQEQTFEMMDPTFLAWDGPEPEPTDPGTDPGTDDGGCNTGGHTGSWALLAALGLGLIALRRRREV